MPKVKIDGHDIEVPKGTTILQAAEQLGIEVPQMCYHPGLSIVGVCRVCLCRVKGQPKLSPACATEAVDGWEIELYSDEAQKARRAVIEFWLLNHPLDCPVCDQGGECPLQDIAFDHGPGVSRLHGAKLRKQKRVDLGPHVVLDEERCILCWRCTRFTQEISGSNQIMLKDRGVYTTVGVPPGQTFDDPFSGNVVDLCPVGALTSHDFRFKSRVWEMSSSEGVCTSCSVGCNTYVWSKKGKVERLTARPNLEVNDYWLCDRGRFDTGFVNRADRMRLPRMRVGGTVVEVEWDEAVAALVEGLRPVADRGVNRAGALFTRHLANEEYWTFQKLIRGSLGSNNLAAGRGELLTPARAALAASGRLATVTDLDEADAVLVLGGNLVQTHPVHALRIRKAVRAHGTRVVLAAPEAGSLASVAAHVEPVSPREAATWLGQLTGKLEAGESTGAAGVLSGAARIVVLVNAGDENPSIVERLDAFLGAAPEGSTRKALVLDEGGNAAGARLLGITPDYFPGESPVTSGAAHALKTSWGGRVHGEPGLGWREQLRAAASGDLAALLLVNSGRPARWGWSDEERKQLGKAPFVVAFDLFANEVEEFAHLILPTTSFAEMDATYTTQDGIVQLARRNIVPRAPSSLQVLAKVAPQLGLKMKGPQTIEVFREISREVPQFAGIDYGRASREGARAEPVLAGA